MGPTHPTDELPYAVRRALDHVRGLSSGPPLDPTLRVTLNFHPDRLVRGEPLLQVMAKAGAYRASGGPGVPPVEDPWPRLDLPARCAVFVATVRTLGVQPTHSEISASALLHACMRM